MYKYIAIIFTILALCLTANPVTAQVSSMPDITREEYTPFVKKRYSINGGWKIERKADKTIITFDENFKTKGGPDLKVFLSRSALSDASNNTVINDAVKLGVLKSNNGRQSYIIPADVDLSEFESVVIHCEAFSVLWGGFDLKG